MRNPPTQAHEIETTESKTPLGWDDIDAELHSSTREAGVGCGMADALTDSEMAVGVANLREAVSRRRRTP